MEPGVHLGQLVIVFAGNVSFTRFDKVFRLELVVEHLPLADHGLEPSYEEIRRAPENLERNVMELVHRLFKLLRI